MLVFAGCTSAPPQDQSPDLAVVDDTPAEPVKIDAALLLDLLTKADTAIEEGRLTYPEADSAYAIFLKILAIQPDQRDALHGLERVVEAYIELTMQALRREQYATARSMLARARLVLPGHPSIKPTDEQIRLLSQAQRTELKLNQDDLKNSAHSISAELQSLARMPNEHSCRFIISAKNDAQGRWIYQTLSKGAVATRIKAQIQIRLPAGVERLCFPA